ncbi:MAG: acyl CoA:acetate/3-ketoacid CoA transferase [Coriobacteriales bacterium]|jgi:propionate CoA-transferase|nr:acyl CoA:acetate/3-ketoacid CoA transferase [Coriobacteriales bacterium]
MVQFITAQQAAELVADGATLGLAGFGLSGFAEEIAKALEDRFVETGHPQNIDLRQSGSLGDGKERGPVHFAHEGMVASWTTGMIGFNFQLGQLVTDNKIKCYCLPQGVLMNLWREIARGGPGVITKVGLGTYVDPRIDGGKMNEVTTEDVVELLEIGGEEYLRYKPLPIDVIIVRGTTADEDGNISFEKESVINEGFNACAAAKASGGITIVQVEYVAKSGSLHPKEVKIPGVLVDYVVVSTDSFNSWQTEGTLYEPCFAGNLRKPADRLPRLDLNARKVIARRAAMELKRGSLVNLGVGIPAGVAYVVAEEGFDGGVVFSAEAGAIGGVPAPLPNFGSSFNGWAIIEQGSMFDIIDGGNLDVTCLGLAEADKDGNLNVSKFGGRVNGPGGFINITGFTPKIIYCGTFMAGDRSIVADGRLIITQPGKAPKFVNTVEQITFSGSEAAKRGLEVFYVTERAVIKLIDGVMTLIEIAPGIDLQTDVLDCMGFVPAISPDLKTMDVELFSETWGRLDETFI